MQKNFNHDISRWKTDSALSMINMFSGAEKILIKTYQSEIHLMLLKWMGCFGIATNFNQDLNSWNVEKVTSMINMFSNTKNFNSNLDNWTT